MINQSRKIPSHIIFSQIQGKPKLPLYWNNRYRQAFDHSEMGDMVDSFQKIWSQMVIFPCQWWFWSINNDPKTKHPRGSNILFLSPESGSHGSLFFRLIFSLLPCAIKTPGLKTDGHRQCATTPRRQRMKNKLLGGQFVQVVPRMGSDLSPNIFERLKIERINFKPWDLKKMQQFAEGKKNM